MIGKLKEIMAGLSPAGEESADDAALDLAAAVLLVEMARADHHLADAEEREICRQLQQGFELDESGARELLARARATVENAVSLHEFTRTLHDGMQYAEKERVIEMLWRVAMADHSLDKYEDYLVGKVAALMYVSRGDVIRIRQRVLESLDR